MIEPFIGLGAVGVVAGVVFLLFSRQIERSVRDASARLFGSSRSRLRMPAWVAGAIFLLFGVVLVSYALATGRA